MGYSGKLAKLFFVDATGPVQWNDGEDVPGTPVFVEVKKAVDISLANGESDADGSNRESDTAMDVGGLKDRTLTVQYRKEQLADALYERFIDSYENYTPLLLQILSGPASGTVGVKGWQAVYRAKNVPEEDPNDGSAISTITLVPWPGRDASGDLIAPSRVTVSS